MKNNFFTYTFYEILSLFVTSKCRLTFLFIWGQIIGNEISAFFEIYGQLS